MKAQKLQLVLIHKKRSNQKLIKKTLNSDNKSDI